MMGTPLINMGTGLLVYWWMYLPIASWLDKAPVTPTVAAVIAIALGCLINFFIVFRS